MILPANGLAWSGIIKVRRRGEDVVFHNRERTVNYRGPLSDELRRWFGRGRQFYAEAELPVGSTIVNLRRKVRERQDW